MTNTEPSLADDIRESALSMVERYAELTRAPLDFSEASLAVVDVMLASLSEQALSADEARAVAQDVGCYVLETAFRALGGRFEWIGEWNEPVLISGEPVCEIAFAAWGKVAGRLAGDDADHLAFHYAGFAECVRAAEPGAVVTFV